MPWSGDQSPGITGHLTRYTGSSAPRHGRQRSRHCSATTLHALPGDRFRGPPARDARSMVHGSEARSAETGKVYLGLPAATARPSVLPIRRGSVGMNTVTVWLGHAFDFVRLAGRLRFSYRKTPNGRGGEPADTFHPVRASLSMQRALRLARISDPGDPPAHIVPMDYLVTVRPTPALSTTPGV